jgi:hypothetical protein
MAAWITVYALQPAELSPADVLAALHATDLHTLAEAFDLDEPVVDAAVAALRMNAGAGLDGACLHYRAPELRPIQFHRWCEPDRVAEELSEVRDGGELDPEVDAGLAGVVEVVALELGWPMLEDMGVVIAWEVARVLAHATGGLVKDHDDYWWRVDEGGGFVAFDD